MKRILKITAVVLLLALGLGLRLYDLTDQPLDFHPTRQLRGALIARSMYYQMLPDADPQARQIAVGIANTTGQYEPSIVEKLVPSRTAKGSPANSGRVEERICDPGAVTSGFSA